MLFLSLHSSYSALESCTLYNTLDCYVIRQLRFKTQIITTVVLLPQYLIYKIAFLMEHETFARQENLSSCIIYWVTLLSDSIESVFACNSTLAWNQSQYILANCLNADVSIILRYFLYCVLITLTFQARLALLSFPIHEM